MTVSRFERWLIWAGTAGTLVTGIAYWWMKDMMTAADPWAVINHPLQPWMLKAHILVAPVLVFGVGLITTRHIWKHFRQGVKKGRRSGLIAAATFAVLVITGYVLQVISGEMLLRVVAWTHLGLGVLYSVGLAAHWPATRGSRLRAASTHRSPRPAASYGEGRVPAHDRRRRTGRTRVG